MVAFFDFFSRYQTDSGLTILHRGHDKPWFHCQLIVHGGQRHDLPGKVGTAHLLEHLVSMGNARYPRREMKEMYRWAVEQGFDMSWGTTSADCTTYGGTVSGDKVPELLDYLSAMTLYPNLDSDLEHEIKIIDRERDEAGELRVRNAMRERGRAMFGDHPLAVADEWPEDDVLYGMTYDDVRAFHAAHYGCENMTLVSCGPTSHDDLRRVADKLFRDPPGRRFSKQAPQPRPRIPAVPRPKTYRCEKDGGKPESVEIEFSWVMPKRDRPIQELLEKTVQTLLFNRIREELCLAYSVQTRCERYADAAIMRVAVIAAPETEKRCIREVRKTLGDDSKLAEEFLHLRSEMLLTARFADKNVKTMVADTVDEFATDGMLRSGKQILAAYQTATAEQIVGLRTNDMSFKNAHLLITEE